MTLLAKWRAWLCARLIDDWHRAYTFSSIRLAAIGALIETFVQAFPGTASEVWNAMPQDLRALLPSWLTGSFPILLLLWLPLTYFGEATIQLLILASGDSHLIESTGSGPRTCTNIVWVIAMAFYITRSGRVRNTFVR